MCSDYSVRALISPDCCPSDFLCYDCCPSCFQCSEASALDASYFRSMFKLEVTFKWAYFVHSHQQSCQLWNLYNCILRKGGRFMQSLTTLVKSWNRIGDNRKAVVVLDQFLSSTWGIRNPHRTQWLQTTQIHSLPPETPNVKLGAIFIGNFNTLRQNIY